MKETITEEVFNRLVKLAEMELDEGEAVYLREQLNHQLETIRELEAIPIDPDIQSNLHGVSYPPAVSQALRADEWKKFDNIEGILSQIPEEMDQWIIVPDTPGEKLD